jgi:hypothetical protein
VAVERSESQLVWPPALLAAEANALLVTGGYDDDRGLGFLLAEAFHADRGLRLLAVLQTQFN